MTDAEREREDIELQQLALGRGFTLDMLHKIYLARLEASGQVLSLPEFWRAVKEGEFDYFLRDSTGQSYS